MSYPHRKLADLLFQFEVNEATKGVVPTNTKKNNAWAERTFDAWVQERNQLMPLDPVPTGLLQVRDASVVSKYTGT